MINCCPGPFCNDFHFQLYIELFVITLITDLPLQPRFFEADVLALYFRGAPTPPFGLPPSSICVIDFRVKALSYIELLNHSQHFAALSQLSSHHFFTLLLTPSESHCSRPFGSHETDADIFAGPGGALAVEDVEQKDTPTNEILSANLQLQVPWQKRHLQLQLHL